MCSSVPSAGSPLALPLGQQLVQAKPQIHPQTSNDQGAAAAQAASSDPHRGKSVNIAV
jgi:hypothetical protein